MKFFYKEIVQKILKLEISFHLNWKKLIQQKKIFQLNQIRLDYIFFYLI